MADILSTLSANYVTVGSSNNYGTSKYVNVDPALYEGSWTGKYSDNSTFKISISDVQGFRAKVRYQSGATVQYQDVLIRDNSLRIGDSKFTLAKQGVAQVKTVMTKNGASTLETAYAQQS